MYWSEVPKSTRDRLLKEYELGSDLLVQSKTLGMTPQTLRRRIQEYRENLRVLFTGQESMVLEIPKPVPETVKPLPPLSEYHYLNPQTDQKQFIQHLQALRDTEQYVAVMHLCDIHFPYHHQPSLDVTYQLVKHVQPHLIAVGSDAGDFSLLSTFINDPDEATTDADVLDEFERYWAEHIRRVRKSAPDAVLFFLIGNHEKRIYDYIMRLAPPIRNTVWRRFVEVVKQSGQVLWLGETDTARIGPLLVTHGTKAGQNPARALWEEAGGQVSVMAGHVHRLSYYGKRGEDYMTEAITSGCLTNYAPYHKRQRHSKWQLGTAIAEVNLQGREVHFENLKFELEPDFVWVRHERRNFSAPIPHDWEPIGE